MHNNHRGKAKPYSSFTSDFSGAPPSAYSLISHHYQLELPPIIFIVIANRLNIAFFMTLLTRGGMGEIHTSQLTLLNTSDSNTTHQITHTSVPMADA